jgi:hypothetical protein
MKKNAGHPVLLQLLVSVYNQSIQTYFYFPEVIICGRQRLERDDFDQLLAEEMVQPYKGRFVWPLVPAVEKRRGGPAAVFFAAPAQADCFDRICCTAPPAIFRRMLIH